MRFGSAEQKQRWLPDLIAGRTLAAFGLTEPDAGSDAAALRTRAVRLAGEHRRLAARRHEGVHHQLRHPDHQRDHRGRPDQAPRGGRGSISTFLVPVGTDGLTVEPPYRKLGWHASDTHPLVLAGCRVGPDGLLGHGG